MYFPYRLQKGRTDFDEIFKVIVFGNDRIKVKQSI